MTDAASTLADIRGAIDGIDSEIVRLLGRRANLVRRAAPLKADREAIQAPDRVARVITRVRALAAEANTNPDLVERIYRAMIEAFIDMEAAE